ncbi:AAA ATPase [Achromobacter phage Mano]|uniref:AAA ATPase n=1 Tax=Achromobacter phage Mano TaxID=2767570 RepID=A0A7L8G6B9_9CAUD|nr:AAA family ATPase [Achromobacter phage Mano]QOE32765.1 AAA ATPase [Achromobacter phage Mano]
MAVLNIRKAERAGARLVLGIAGISGSGKTYSALQLAWGLAGGDASKVGFIDTENRRGSLYADILKRKDGTVDQFLIGDLDAPFSPQRYIDAILEFQKAGVEVLVIDSVTHEWEGTGGCEEIANPPGRDLKVARWNDAKAEHKRFMNAMLQCDMHIIACIRAREKTKVTKDANGKTVFEPQGVLPVQEKNFMFEMTASLMMWDGGKSRDVMKCPADLVPVFGAPGEIHQDYLGARHGLALRQWVQGGVALDPKTEHARNTLRTVAEKGVAELTKAWRALPEDVRTALGGKCPDEIKASAEAFDKARVAAQPGGEALDDLNKQVLGDGAQAAA